jgi:hypothetical protein
MGGNYHPERHRQQGEFLQDDKHCTDAHSIALIRTFHASVPQWGRSPEAVAGMPTGAVVSELAGHSSIDTTSIYSTQELARKIRET